MQIYEITKRSLREGLLGNVGRGFVQGLTGVDFPRAQPKVTQPKVDMDALKSAQSALTVAKERTVITISQPGQTVPAQYYKTGNVWTNELGTAITDPKQTAYLEKLIPTHGKKEVIPTEPVATKARKTFSRRRTPK
jgi:hypothetical protein